MPNIWYSIYELRARGTFAEPSGLAAFLAAAFGYFGASALTSSGKTRWWHAFGLAATLATYGLAKAGTGLAGIAGVIMVGAITWMVRTGGRPVRLPRWGRVAAWVGVVVAVAASPVLYMLTVGLVQQKVSTVSAVSRSAADGHAFQVFLQSFGLGVGLGSNRPSSLFMLLLSNVGLVGTLMFVLVIVLAALGGFRNTSSRPLVWALVAAVAAGVSSKPDLSEPMLWLLLALCIRAGGDVDVARGRLGAAARRPSTPLRVAR